MAESTRETVPIRLLGPVEVAAGADLRGTKQPLALGLLAARAGEIVPTNALVDVLWTDEPPADPRRSLQVHISNLRQVLDDAGVAAAIDHRRHGYVLEVDRDAVDVCRFETLIERGVALVEGEPERARELLAAGLALWRGRPLGRLGDHPSMRGEVARLEDLRLRALEARIDADLATGRHADVTDELRRLTREHPLREALWGRLMTALYRSGRQAEALEAYEAARRVLAEQLGSDPSRPLQELHGRILRQEDDLQPHSDAAGPSPLPDARVLAILPFDVFGDAADVSAVALGLHNDLLTELSRIPELTVISRTSVLGYAGTEMPIPAIGRELNAGTIAEGTVQTSGGRLRLTVQLIDAPSDAHRWAENYDCELRAENLFAVQTELAREIAAALSAELTDRGGGPPPTNSLDAYRLVAKARQQYDLRTEDGFRGAIELYEQAVDLDPAYADAWVGLADALTMMDGYGHGDRHELLPRAERAVHRALALDQDSAGAHTSLAILHCMHQDGPASIREFEHAIRLQPSYADAHDMYTWVLLLVGRADQALTAAVRTVELDPVSAEPLAHLALALAATGSPREGVDAARRARRFSPYTTADFYEGICLTELGRHDEARRVLEPLTVAARGEPAVPWAGRGPDATLAVSLAADGRTDAARTLLDGIDGRTHPFAAGLVRLALGDVDEAAEAFARVEQVTAWPALAIHLFHRDVWAAAPGLRDDLRRVAHRSWRLDPPSTDDRYDSARSDKGEKDDDRGAR